MKKEKIDETSHIVDETLTGDETKAKKSLNDFIKVFIVCLIFVIISLGFKYPRDIPIRLAAFFIVIIKYFKIMKNDKIKIYLRHYTALFVFIIAIIIVISMGSLYFNENLLKY